MKNAINEIENRLNAMNRRLQKAEERNGDLEDKIIENNEAEQKRERKIRNTRIDLEISVTPT